MNPIGNGTNFMNIQDFDCIGFDLDHTLCKYKLDNFFSLVYEYCAKALVEVKGYDESLLQPLQIHKDLCVKGLVWDTMKGDFLKLSETGVILRASHGTRALSDAEIEERYGTKRRWQHFQHLEETLEQTEFYRYFENYYEMPFVVLAALMVDLEEKKSGGWAEASQRVYTDIKDVYNQAFSQHFYQEKLPAILTDCTSNPSQYVERCSQHLKSWLKGLHDQSKMVFLLTSAQADFASDLMDYILGDDWKSYFHICLFFACKPGFFKTHDPTERPFYTTVDGVEGEIATELQAGQWYTRGNAKTFNDYLKKVTGKEQPKVLYFGDSMRSDVHPSTVFSHWHSVLVLEEMEVEELVPNGPFTDQADGPTVRAAPSQLEREFLLSNQWGSFFTDTLPILRRPSGEDSPDTSASASSTTVVNTLWTRFMKMYATIAIPTMDYMSDFPTDYKFETFKSSDWRKGYHPGIPKDATL